MAEISAEQLIAVRQFALDIATQAAGLKGNPDAILADAAAVERFILTGATTLEPQIAMAPAPVASPAVRSRAKRNN